MGKVYKALHTKLGRVVAVKVLSGSRVRDERAIARFHREMKAVGLVNHPNIVQAQDARDVDGINFLVMEYVDGIDLWKLVDRQGPYRSLTLVRSSGKRPLVFSTPTSKGWSTAMSNRGT